MYHVINDLERIGDHAENIAEFAQVRIEDKKIVFSDKAIEELQNMADKVLNLLNMSNKIFKEHDIESASNNVAPLEQEIDDLENKLKKKAYQASKKRKMYSALRNYLH